MPFLTKCVVSLEGAYPDRTFLQGADDSSVGERVWAHLIGSDSVEEKTAPTAIGSPSRTH